MRRGPTCVFHTRTLETIRDSSCSCFLRELLPSKWTIDRKPSPSLTSPPRICRQAQDLARAPPPVEGVACFDVAEGLKIGTPNMVSFLLVSLENHPTNIRKKRTHPGVCKGNLASPNFSWGGRTTTPCAFWESLALALNERVGIAKHQAVKLSNKYPSKLFTRNTCFHCQTPWQAPETSPRPPSFQPFTEAPSSLEPGDAHVIRSSGTKPRHWKPCFALGWLETPRCGTENQPSQSELPKFP